MYYLLFTIGMATLCDAAPVPATNVFNAAAVCTSKHKYFDQTLEDMMRRQLKKWFYQNFSGRILTHLK